MQEERNGNFEEIVNRLKLGMKFGLFENGMKCYFQDGKHISYNDLWKAIRLSSNDEDIQKRSLTQICPNTYVGSHPYKYTQHNWKK